MRLSACRATGALGLDQLCPQGGQLRCAAFGRVDIHHIGLGRARHLHATGRVPDQGLDGGAEALPAHGDPVVLGDREIGWVASAARHYELGPIATAIIKRSVDPAADLVVRAESGDIAAGQEPVILVR